MAGVSDVVLAEEVLLAPMRVGLQQDVREAGEWAVSGQGRCEQGS